jgi:hypothetical protein
LSDSLSDLIGVTVLFSQHAQEKRGLSSGNGCSFPEAVEMVWLVLVGQFRKT